MTEAVRVLLADDHVLYRRGVEMVLAQEPDIRIVGEASDGAEALACTVELTPDVILMDVRMPSVSGIEACRAIKEQVPASRIVMLTVSDDEHDLFEAVKAGAAGYLLKDVPPHEVATSIRAVHQGQALISPSIAGRLLTEFAQLSRQRIDVPAVVAPRLTQRELEVLRLVAHGLGNREIAVRLYISENTVKNHVRNILEKLQLHSRVAAAMYAVRERLVDPLA